MEIETGETCLLAKTENKKPKGENFVALAKLFSFDCIQCTTTATGLCSFRLSCIAIAGVVRFYKASLSLRHQN